jgi:hypothetical protein
MSAPPASEVTRLLKTTVRPASLSPNAPARAIRTIEA